MLKKAISLKLNSTTGTALTLLAALAVSLTSCKKNEGDSASPFGNRSTSAVSYATAATYPVKTITATDLDNGGTVVFDRDTVYEVSGVVYVTNNTTLEIQSGTYIKSSVNTPNVQNGVLVVSKDGTINAAGESCNPIVFTSRYLLDGNPATAAAPGDFGGIILLGESTVNTATGSSNIEGLTASALTAFGGNTPADNSGVFKNVRIEYAGYKLADGIEVNGLTLGGVGSLTEINNVEVSWGLDDGFEFFGGTVSTSDLLAFSNDDDQFDFDLGYIGTLLNSTAIANKVSSHSASSGNSDSNGAEIDNNPTNFAAFPVTHPTFDNVRIIGALNTSGVTAPGFKNGITVRRGGELELYGSIVTGYNIGLRIDGNATPANTIVGSTSLHGFTLAYDPNTFTDAGGNTYNNGATAFAYGITQPFWNESAFNADLNYCWAKFDY
ncbi:autotransporter outer membrane beta-barrel domain-containing protein [Pedobacter hiemivivus]|uniref:T9SS C-terminal target domain-containing protein n=1 Tax=Pedobacter hiemivivus TaxID=2530454 RepID=A0A4R0MCE1_9SPHI|nr:hypothetical protein [Pedobacter hiemivivus]TCC84018.1 hypothetical protein EZ444_25710 [Pedobacter hiemivivus]